MTLTQLTTVELPERLCIRLRFGHPIRSQRLDSGVQLDWFAPGQVFAVRWEARLSPRRRIAGLAVAETLDASVPDLQVSHCLPYLQRAVRVYAWLVGRCVGRNRGVIDSVEQTIQTIESQGIDPATVPPIYYRLATQALRVGRSPRPINPRQLTRFLEDRPHVHP